MLKFYRNLHPAGRLGLWGLPVLLLGIALLVVEMGKPELPRATNYPGLAAPNATENPFVVRLGQADRRAQQTSYRPVATSVHDQLAQRLFELDILYQQLSLNIDVHAVENPDLQQVARQLNDLLITYELGSSGIAAPRPTAVDTPAVLYFAAREANIAFAFLSAISPYIHTLVTLVEDPDLAAGRMQLHLLAAPRFAEDGTVVLD